MDQFTIHKILPGAPTTTDNAVYFEQITADAGAYQDWFIMKVTNDGSLTSWTSKLAIPITPGDNVGNDETSGLYFSDLTTNWPTNGVAQIPGRIESGYVGAAGLGRSMILGSDFNATFDTDVGAWIIGVDGVGTGITSWTASLNGSGATSSFNILSSASGGTPSANADQSITAALPVLDIAFQVQTTKKALLAPENNTSGQPLWRNIRAGNPEIESTITVAERGDVLFEGDTWSEGASTRWFGLMADLETGVDKFGKQVEFDTTVFSFNTSSPTGSTTTWDQISLNLTGLGWNVGDGTNTDFIDLNNDQLDFTTNSGVNGTGDVLFFDIIDAATATPEMRLKAVDPGADSFVWYKNTTTETGLTYGTFGTGLSFNPATGVLTATGTAPKNGTLELSIAAAAGTSGAAIEIGTGTGFSADTASNLDYEIEIGPSLSALATIMANGSTGILNKSGIDTYTLVGPFIESFTVAATTGSAAIITDAETITFVGAGGLATSIAGNTVTITNNSPNVDQNLYETFAGNSGSTTANSTTDTLSVVGGAGVDVVATTDTLTINLVAEYTSDWKESVRAATTANITIATALNVGDIIDGVTLADGDRVLVKNQSTSGQNGIYIAGASPARSEDMNADAEISSGNTVSVEEGTDNSDSIWQITTNGAIAIDDPHTWTKVASSAAFLDVGAGLLKNTGTTPPEVTFAQPGGSTPVVIGNTYSGLNYETDAIKVSLASTLNFQSQSVGLADFTNLSVYAGTGGAGAPSTVTASADAQVLTRSGTALAFALLENVNIASGAGIQLSKLETIDPFTVLGNPDTGTGVPVEIAVSADSVLARIASGNIAPVVIDTSLEFLGHDTNSLGAKSFSSDNFEWDTTTTTQLNSKWTTNDW